MSENGESTESGSGANSGAEPRPEGGTGLGQSGALNEPPGDGAAAGGGPSDGGDDGGAPGTDALGEASDARPGDDPGADARAARAAEPGGADDTDVQETEEGYEQLPGGGHRITRRTVHRTRVVEDVEETVTEYLPPSAYVAPATPGHPAAVG